MYILSYQNVSVSINKQEATVRARCTVFVAR